MEFHILHIADPHFSRCHYDDPDPVATAKNCADDLRRQIDAYRTQEALQNRLWKGKFDAIVVSGDFTFRCKENGFRAAKAFIEIIAEWAKPLGLVLIPGNHDIDLGEPAPFGGVRLPNRKADAEKSYRAFLSSLPPTIIGSNALSSSRLSTVRRIGRAGRPGLVILALNSCRVERSDAQGWGYVGADQIREIADELVRGPVKVEKGDLVMAVLHHHPLPLWDVCREILSRTPDQRKLSFLMDAATTLNALFNLGVGLIVHGHTHITSLKSVEGYGVDPVAGRQVLILGAGSLGFLTEPDDPASHFQIICLRSDGQSGFAADVNLRDFTASPSSPGSVPRDWKMSPDIWRPLMRVYDPGAGAKGLSAIERTAQIADHYESVAESWAQLRYRGAPDWPVVLADIVKTVKTMATYTVTVTVTEADVARVIKELETKELDPDDAFSWTLEQYLLRCLERP